MDFIKKTIKIKKFSLKSSRFYKARKNNKKFKNLKKGQQFLDNE